MTSGVVIEWAAAGAALAGESGDLDVVALWPGGALVAVIDGLGHGSPAAEAARAAAEILEADPTAPVAELVQRCHAGLRKTRGAVLSLVAFDAAAGAVTCVGVGNVEGELVRIAGGRDTIALRGGVVGYQLPPLRVDVYPVAAGDLVILATDGVRHGFTADVAHDRAPGELADAILARHARGTDDALVVVVRYLGGAA